MKSTRMMLSGLLLAGTIAAHENALAGLTVNVVGPDDWTATGTLGDWAAEGGGTGAFLDPGDFDTLFTLDTAVGLGAGNGGDGLNTLVTIYESLAAAGAEVYGVTFGDAARPLQNATTAAYKMSLLNDEQFIAAEIDSDTTLFSATSVVKDISVLKGQAPFLTLVSLDGVPQQALLNGTSIYVQDTFNVTDPALNSATNSFAVGIPEIDGLAGTGALTLLGGMLALVGERRRKS